MERMDNDMLYALEWNQIEEVVDRLVEYFESNGWNLSNMRMDVDDLIDPKSWIENLRKKRVIHSAH